MVRYDPAKSLRIGTLKYNSAFLDLLEYLEVYKQDQLRAMLDASTDEEILISQRVARATRDTIDHMRTTVENFAKEHALGSAMDPIQR
jgi:hypothetical protein